MKETEFWFVKMTDNFQTTDLEGPYDSHRKAEIVAIFRTFPVDDYERRDPYVREGEGFWIKGNRRVSIVSRTLNPYFKRDVEMALACGIPKDLVKE